MDFDLIGAIASGVAFGLFGLCVFCWVLMWHDQKRKERRYLKAVQNQAKATEVAYGLIAFDQTMTREHLIRSWEEL